MRLFLAVLVLLSLAPAAAAAERPPCRPKGASTVGGSGAVRVYAIRGRMVACSYASRRTRRLGAVSGDDTREFVMRVAVRGRWVAWVLGSQAGSSQGPYSRDRVVLADVRRGRLVDFGGTGCDVPPRTDGFYDGRHVPGLAVTRHGRMVWSCIAGRFADQVHEIRAYDADGPRVLDRSGPYGWDPDPVDPGSLAVVEDPHAAPGGRVYWSRGSGPRSAGLR